MRKTGSRAQGLVTQYLETHIGDKHFLSFFKILLLTICNLPSIWDIKHEIESGGIQLNIVEYHNQSGYPRIAENNFKAIHL